MDLLIAISKIKSATLVVPLLRASYRINCKSEIFLTHEGVCVLNDQHIVDLLNETGTPAIACHDSWVKYANAPDCPVTLGSQTNYSEMMARATQVISF